MEVSHTDRRFGMVMNVIGGIFSALSLTFVIGTLGFPGEVVKLLQKAEIIAKEPSALILKWDDQPDKDQIVRVYRLVNTSNHPVKIDKIVFNGHCDIGARWPKTGIIQMALAMQGMSTPNLNLTKTGDNFLFTAGIVNMVCEGLSGRSMELVRMEVYVDADYSVWEF
jgi:hypothetical protein